MIVQQVEEEEQSDDLASLAALRAEISAARRRAPAPVKAPKVLVPKVHTLGRRNKALRITKEIIRTEGDMLSRAEDLATEQWGQGTAVSLESKASGWVATVWSREGGAVEVCAPRQTQTAAIKLLYGLLKEAKRKR